MTEVAVLHESVRQVNVPTIPVGVYTTDPKFNPEMVTELPIDDGRLDEPV